MSRSVFPSPERASLPTISGKKMPPPQETLLSRQGDKTSEARANEREFQGYLERVRNYIPTEIVAFFIFVNALIGDEVRNSEGSLTADGYIAVLAPVAAIIGCILFVRTTAKAEDNPVWVLQATISTLALLIWIYAVDAKVLSVFEIPVVPSVSGFLVACFTLLSGLIVPSLANNGDDDNSDEGGSS